MLPLGLLPAAILQTWQAAEPDSTDDFAGDCRRYAAYWELARELLGNLPAKPARNDEQARAAETIQQKARAARQRVSPVRRGNGPPNDHSCRCRGYEDEERDQDL